MIIKLAIMGPIDLPRQITSSFQPYSFEKISLLGPNMIGSFVPSYCCLMLPIIMLELNSIVKALDS